MKKYNNINFVLATLMFIITFVSLFFLPDRVPTHTHFEGVDGWGSKYTYLIAPAIAYILWFFMPKFMSQKSDETKLLGEKAGNIYLLKNKIIINIIFILFVGFDLYWIYQEFLYTSNNISLNFFLLIGIAVLYITASFSIFYMDNEELMMLHWKEFTLADSSLNIRKKKLLFLISGCVVAMLIIADALFYTKSFLLIFVLLLSLVLKFMIGPIKARLMRKK